MRNTMLLPAVAIAAGLACAASTSARAEVEYHLTGTDGYHQAVDIEFDTDNFISLPSTITNPIICSGCTTPASIAISTFSTYARFMYSIGTGNESMYFALASVASPGTYSTETGDVGTLTVSTLTAVPEPASLAVLACGLLGLGIAVGRRRLQPGSPIV